MNAVIVESRHRNNEHIYCRDKMIFISNCKIINNDENENNNRLNKYDNRSVFLYTCLESRMILAITSELLLYV